MSNEPPWEEWSDHHLNSEQWTQASMSRGLVKFSAEPIGRYTLPPSLSDACVAIRRLDGNLLINLEEEPDLFVQENQHLLCSDAMKHIMAGICNLAQAGQVSMEVTGDYYQNTPTTWRPWHHVYSLCQAGKATHHAPQVNRAGKYIIRLYYLGAWRRIYVDDMVPVNAKGKCLLPTCTRKQGNTEPSIQLWPPLLCKALLRIASLTWTKKNELYGWNVYTCLTGWQQLKLDCCKLQPAFTWRLCLKLLSQARKNPHVPMKEFHSDGSGDGYGDTLHTCASMLLFALSGTETTPIIVTQTLVFSDANIQTAPTKLARWKMYRWKEWAINHGLYEEQRIHMDRILKFYYPLGRIANLPPLANRTITLLEDIPKLPLKSMSYLNRPSPTSKKGKPPPKKFMDPAEWLDFKDIFPMIKHIEIFFKTSTFQCTENVQEYLRNAGIPESYMASTLKKTNIKSIPMFRPKTDISWIQEQEANFYLVIDSVAPKYIFISLSILPECQPKSSGTSIQLVQDTSDADVKSKVSLVGTLISWNTPIFQEPLFTIKTGGSVSKIVSLPAGKCFMCIWCYMPVKHLSLIFASQTTFSLHLVDDAYEEMSIPGIALERRSLEFVKRLKIVLNTQIIKGRTKFNVLHDMYRALLPDSNYPENIRAKFYEALMTIASRAPEFQTDPEYKTLVADIKSLNQSRTYSTLFFEEQKILKRILKNQSWIFASTSTVGKQLTLNTSQQSSKLAKSSIFPIVKRETRFRDTKSSFISDTVDENLKFGVTLFKLLFQGQDSLYKRYPLLNDIDHLVSFKDWYGSSELSVEHEWIPMTKYVINHTRSSEEVTCLVTFSTKLKLWNMVIINNETLTEAPKLIKHFMPIKFVNGQSYTIFVYAWLPKIFMSSPVSISWRLRIFAPEYDNIPHSCHLQSNLHCSEMPPRKMVLKEIRGGYMPNSRSIIFRTILRCEKNTDFSVRVCLSNPFAKFKLTIKCMDEIVISTRNAVGELIIPVVKLLQNQNTFCTNDVFYTMEGILLDNSWVLTEEEIELSTAYKYSICSFKEGILPKLKSRFSVAKMRGTKGPMSMGSINTSRSYSQSSSFLFQNRVPLWSVSVALERENSCTFTVDNRLEEQLVEMKMSWESNDPGRAELGKQLREEFILKRKSGEKQLQTQLSLPKQFTLLTEQKVFLDKCIRDDNQRIFFERHANNKKEMENAMLVTKRYDAIITNTLQYLRLQNIAKVDEWLQYRKTLMMVPKKVRRKKRK